MNTESNESLTAKLVQIIERAEGGEPEDRTSIERLQAPVIGVRVRYEHGGVGLSFPTLRALAKHYQDLVRGAKLSDGERTELLGSIEEWFSLHDGAA